MEAPTKNLRKLLYILKIRMNDLSDKGNAKFFGTSDTQKITTTVDTK